MLYKPKFCCQCGDKIERVNWNLKTSRRFCELCETEFVLHEWLPKIGLGICLIFGIFFIGSFFQSSDNQEKNDSVKLLTDSSKNVEKQLAEIPANQSSSKNLIATPLVQTQTNSQSTVPVQGIESRKKADLLQNQQNDKKEAVYFCGAETKKGTPCSRKVKGGGRCWQHTGRAAMLPENQLSASQ